VQQQQLHAVLYGEEQNTHPPPALGASADGASDGRVEPSRCLFKGGDTGSSSSGSKSDESLSLSCFALCLLFPDLEGLREGRGAYFLEESAVSSAPIGTMVLG
jgi:hypothetical protein